MVRRLAWRTIRETVHDTGADRSLTRFPIGWPSRVATGSVALAPIRASGGGVPWFCGRIKPVPGEISSGRSRWASRPGYRPPQGPSDARESGASRRASKGLSGVVKPRHPSNHGAGRSNPTASARQKRRALRAGGSSSAGLNSVRFASLRETGPPPMTVRTRSRRSAGSPGRDPAFSECPQEPPAFKMPAPSAHSGPSRGPAPERQRPVRHIEGLDHLVLPATPGRS
jgi:hypothetical protein